MFNDDKMHLNELVLEKVGKEYPLHQKDLGENAELSSKGMHFKLSAYEIEGIGHLALMDMSGMLGAMKMQTAIITVYTKDVPLMNLDYINALGKETFLGELYDMEQKGIEGEYNEQYYAVKRRDEDLERYESGPHWYDPYLLSCTYGRKGKKVTKRFMNAASDYTDIFLRQIKEAPAADLKAKEEANRSFALGLLEHGGPAVDQFRKLFGEEKTQKIVKEILYGVK